MRTHKPLFSSNAVVSGCTTHSGIPCVNTTRNILKYGTHHTITSCEFTGISTPLQSGGAIYLHGDDSSDSTTLYVDHCVFQSCSTTGDHGDQTGGGAVYTDCGSLLSISSSIFIHCSTNSYGGAVYAQKKCKSAVLSSCTFRDCSALTGGSFMTYIGPANTVSSSHFIFSAALWVGGGLYHAHEYSSGFLSLSNCLFTRNIAHYTNDSDLYVYRGGGGFEDGHVGTYKTECLFSFFTANSAPNGVGEDISVVSSPLSRSPLTHCLTTSSLSFWNQNAYTNNWLPWTSIYVSFRVVNLNRYPERSILYNRCTTLWYQYKSHLRRP